VRTDLPAPVPQAQVNGPRITATDFGYTGQRNVDGLGLMDYHARMYDSHITQFSQPDSIVPDPNNPQSLNRYSYALNNPVRYNDPTGHCVDPLTAALCGLIAGVVVDYGIQVYHNYQNGMSTGDAFNLSNINKKELAVAAVGGAVAGLTMGLAAGAAGVFAETAVGQTFAFTTQYVVGGAIANSAAGQAEALAGAALDNNGRIITQSDNEYYARARLLGYGNTRMLRDDVAVGAVTGLILGGLKASIGADQYMTKYLANREPGPVVRAGSVVVDEVFGYINRDSKKRIPN